jgi:hypothetical protein
VEGKVQIPILRERERERENDYELKIFANHIPDEGPISKIYEEFNPIRKQKPD